MKGHNFSSDVEVIVAAETWLDRQPSELFLSGLQKLPDLAMDLLALWYKCVQCCSSGFLCTVVKLQNISYCSDNNKYLIL